MEDFSIYTNEFNNSIPYNILMDDKSKTIGNYEISNEIGTVPVKDDLYYVPKKFGNEIKNENFYQKKLNNSFNTNISPFSFSQSFLEGNYLNKNINNNNLHKSRIIDDFITENKNSFYLGDLIDRKSLSGHNSPIKQIKSKYSSVSENKSHFIKKRNGIPKNEIPIFSENNIFKSNMAPINSERSFMQKNKSFETFNNDNSISDYIYNTDYNTISSFMLDQNPMQNQFNNTNIYQTRNNIDIKDNNKLVNNKNTSNYNYNTINVSRFKDNIEILKLAQNNNNNMNNKLISNYNVLTNVANNYNINNNNDPLGNKYIINNNLPFYKNQGKQNSYDKIINNIKMPNNEPEFATVTPISVLNLVKEPEFATVTKVSSIHQKERNFSEINKNRIPAQINNLTFNTTNLMINNDQTKKEEVINNNKKLNEETNQNINNMSQNQIINDNQAIKQNNKINEQQNKNINQKNKQKKIINIQRIPIKSNEEIFNPRNKKDLNENKKKKLNKKGINKIQDITITKITNQTIDGNKNIDIDNNKKIDKHITPQPSSNNTPRTKQILESKYKTGTNKIIINDNINITQNKNQTNAQSQNDSQIYKPEKTVTTNDDKDLKNIKKNNTNVNVFYSDFDGSGYIKNYCGVSQPGKDIEGNTKINQDAIVFLTNINNIKDFNIFGVLDGHGPAGHFVSKYISNYIPTQLINHPEIKKLKNPEKIYKKFKENNCKIITDAFVSSDEVLKNVDFDVLQSGTTCCLVIHIGKHILCANTGDSRALVTFDESNNKNSKKLNNLQAVALSIDYKPELPEESKRIMMSGGVIEKIRDEYGQGVGPFRVWAGEEDYPGLAMSRSIGDLRGKTVGIIPNPGILEYDLNKTTKFIIACSDGVFEYLTNEKVKDLGKKFYIENNASDYCHKLIKLAFDQWLKNDTFVDDITAVVAFF